MLSLQSIFPHFSCVFFSFIPSSCVHVLFKKFIVRGLNKFNSLWIAPMETIFNINSNHNNNTTTANNKMLKKKIFNLDKLMKNHTIRIIMKKKMANGRNGERERGRGRGKEMARDYMEYSSASTMLLCCVCCMYILSLFAFHNINNGAAYLVCRLHLLAYIFRNGGCFCIEYSGSYIQSMFMCLCISRLDVFVRVCTHILTHTHIYTYISIDACIYVNVYVCIFNEIPKIDERSPFSAFSRFNKRLKIEWQRKKEWERVWVSEWVSGGYELLNEKCNSFGPFF